MALLGLVRNQPNKTVGGGTFGGTLQMLDRSCWYYFFKGHWLVTQLGIYEGCCWFPCGSR